MKRQRALIFNLLSILVRLTATNAERYFVLDQGSSASAPTNVATIIEGNFWGIGCTADKLISWTKNGERIPELERGEMRVLQRNHSLVADYAFKQHEGRYTCTADNTTSIQIFIKPFAGPICKRPGNVFIGQDVQIMCWCLQKNSEWSWSWKFEGTDLAFENSHIAISEDKCKSAIYIESIQQPQSGWYHYGSADVHHFNLNVMIEDGCIGSTYVVEGQPWSIECRMWSRSSTADWMKNGKPIKNGALESQGIQVTKSYYGTSTLSAASADISHSGRYGGSPDASTFLWVIRNDHIYYSGPQEVFEHEQFSIFCVGFQGEDDVKWTRNGQPIDELATGAMQVYTEGRISRIFASEALQHYQGSYSCHPNSDQSFSLSIRKSGYLGSRVVWESEPWQIECKFDGENVSYWTKDGKLINFNEISYQPTRNGSKIYSYNASKEHEGDYSCNENYYELFHLSVVERNNYFGLQQVQEEQMWSIECPIPFVGVKVEWTRDGVPIANLSESQRIRVTNTSYGTSKLYSRWGYKHHEGGYRCSPGPNKTFHLSIIVRDRYSGPPVAWEDDSWFIICKGAGSQENVQWTKDNQSISRMIQSKEVHMMHNKAGHSRLYSHRALKQHEGNYQCSLAPSKSFYLSVADKAGYFGRGIVWQEESWSIECQRSPGVTTVWTKNGKVVDALMMFSGLRKINTPYGTSKLCSDSALAIHQGEYQCVPGPESTFPLLVVEKGNYIGTHSVWEEDSWFVMCQVGARGTPTWTKDGKPIDALLGTNELQILIEDGYSKLYSNYTNTRHRGQYKCTPGPDKSFSLIVHEKVVSHGPIDLQYLQIVYMTCVYSMVFLSILIVLVLYQRKIVVFD